MNDSPVSRRECERIRERAETSTLSHVADELGWSRRTVQRHVNDNCTHRGATRGETECPLCETVVTSLAKHLRNECDERGSVGGSQ